MNPNNRRRFLLPLAIAMLLVVPSALAYLLQAHRYGFFNDDWFLVYPGTLQGPGIFHTIFAGDRPARAYLVGAFYSLFGNQAPLYSYSAYLLRLVEGFSLYWILQLVWPRQRTANLAAALLAVVYPGFLDQPNAFDFQSHLFSLSAGTLSIALSLQAYQIRNRKILSGALGALACALALIYLLLIEYFIGLEGLRFLLLGYLVAREEPGRWSQKLKKVLLAALPYLAAVGVFFFWRAALFHNTREDTDLGRMLAALLADPLNQGGWLAVHVLQDFFSITLGGWTIPLVTIAFPLRLRDFLTGLALAAAAGTGVGVLLGWLSRDRIAQGAAPSFNLSVVVIGALGVLLSSLPIALGDRSVVYPSFTRFALPGSLSAALLTAALLFSLPRRFLAVAGVGALTAIAVLSHFANGLGYAALAEDQRLFWWQLSWRAPQIAGGTTLVAGAPQGLGLFDYVVWGPANLIYYPEIPPVGGGTLKLSAAILTPDVIQGILVGGSRDGEDRGMRIERDYSSLLVLWMPARGDCLQVMDGKALELPSQIRERVNLVAPYSNAGLILTGAAAHQPPAAIFGREPEHGWCYLYEKASLARQVGDWAAIVRLGDEAAVRGLRPNDPVEWMPFILGYAHAGRDADARRLAAIVKSDSFLRVQACREFSPPASAQLQQLFCGN